MFADDIKTAAILKAKHVNTDEKDAEGKTALDIAESNEQMRFVHYVKGELCVKYAKVSLKRVFLHFTKKCSSLSALSPYPPRVYCM